MHRHFALADRSPTIAPMAVFAMLAVVLAIWFQFTMYVAFLSPMHAIYMDVPLQLTLLAVFGVTCFAWMSLHAFGLVGGGSGAGFRLVLLGLAARIHVSMLVTTTGAEADGSIYDALPRVAVPVRLVRNGSLVAIGCGLMLVVLASVVDLMRRRRGHRWVAVND